MTADILPFSEQIKPAEAADCVLRNIHDAIKRHQNCRKQQEQAIRIFATINGFRIRGMRKYAFDKHKICDHTIYLGGALIGQPYPAALNDWRGMGEAIAARYGLAFHVPPIPTASFHLPGSTLFLVFTKPGHVMTWLPEQINGIAGVTSQDETRSPR
jgi:hypothetical protein